MGVGFRRARNFYHLIDSAVTTNFYCFNLSLKWPLLPIFNAFPPQISLSAHYVRTVRDPGASVSADLFEAAAMKAVEKDLLAMKVGELKEELEARGEGRTGNKAWLRRRLHAAIVREYLGS